MSNTDTWIRALENELKNVESSLYLSLQKTDRANKILSDSYADQILALKNMIREAQTIALLKSDREGASQNKPRILYVDELVGELRVFRGQVVEQKKTEWTFASDETVTERESVVEFPVVTSRFQLGTNCLRYNAPRSYPIGTKFMLTIRSENVAS